MSTMNLVCTENGGSGWTRRRVVGTALPASAGVLAACAMPGSDQAPVLSDKEATITYVTDWAATTRGEYLKKFVPRFTEENPKIKVQVDNWAGEDVTTIALANAAAGTLQDVMLGGTDLFIQLARSGEMKDVTPVLKSLKLSMDDVVHLKSSIIHQGKQYGVPFQPNMNVLVINKNMFRNANVPLPTDKTTYPDLLDLLRRVSRPDENVWGMESRYGTPQWAHYIWAWGGDLVSPDFKRTLLDQPIAIEAMQFMIDLTHRHRVAPPITAANAFPPGVNRNNGNLALGYTSSPIRGFGQNVAAQFELDFMYHPIGPRTGKRYVPIADQPNIVTGAANKRGVFDQAVRFAAWLAWSTTAQEGMAEGGPEVPVLKSVLNSAKYLTPPPASMKVVFDQIANYRELPIFLGQGEWNLEVRKGLIPAFTGEKSITEALREATRLGDVVLAKYAAR